jgi:hypothetical protein
MASFLFHDITAPREMLEVFKEADGFQIPLSSPKMYARADGIKAAWLFFETTSPSHPRRSPSTRGFFEYIGQRRSRRWGNLDDILFSRDDTLDACAEFVAEIVAICGSSTWPIVFDGTPPLSAALLAFQGLQGGREDRRRRSPAWPHFKNTTKSLPSEWYPPPVAFLAS